MCFSSFDRSTCLLWKRSVRLNVDEMSQLVYQSCEAIVAMQYAQRIEAIKQHLFNIRQCLCTFAFMHGYVVIFV